MRWRAKRKYMLLTQLSWQYLENLEDHVFKYISLTKALLKLYMLGMKKGQNPEP